MRRGCQHLPHTERFAVLQGYTRPNSGRTPSHKRSTQECHFYAAVRVTNLRCFNPVYTAGGVVFLVGLVLSIPPPTDTFAG